MKSKKMNFLFVFLCFLSVQISAAPISNVVTNEGEGEGCKKLLESLKQHSHFDLADVPSYHEAGKPFKGVLHLRKDFKLSPEEWNQIVKHSAIRLSIKEPYPRNLGVENKSLAEFLFSETSETSVPFEIEIGSHIGGEFDLYWSIMLFDDDGMCIAEGQTGKKINIRSENVHMVPPLLESLSFDRLSYSVGEMATATFKLSSPLGKLETSHFEFINRLVEDNGSIPVFEPDLLRQIKQIDETTYSIGFRIPRCASPGKYFLEYFNREDSFGNSESYVGKHDADELSISKASPLIIEDSENQTGKLEL